jgi:hypothetical protein
MGDLQSVTSSEGQDTLSGIVGAESSGTATANERGLRDVVNDIETADPGGGGIITTTNRQDEPEYEVGYGKPPREFQFKTGQRVKGAGRPPGSKNLATILERILRRPVSMRRGNNVVKVPMAAAIYETYALKAIEGDRPAFNAVFNVASKAGLLNRPKDDAENGNSSKLIAAASSGRPSDKYAESIDLNLLSREEQVELSRLLELLDACDDVLGLEAEKLLRLQQLLSKGRAGNVVPQDNEDVKKAA